MISEAYFNNVNTLRRAAAEGELTLLSSRINETKQPVALVASMVAMGDEVVVTPFGYIDVPNAIDESNKPSPEVRAEFTRLLARLRARDLALLEQDRNGHVRAGFFDTKEKVNSDCNLVLAWGNPCELFEDPMQ